MNWHKGPIPIKWRKKLEGKAVLVILKRSGAMQEIEYYGKPIAVMCYMDKLKTTYYPTRIEHDCVSKWAILEEI